MFVVFYQIVRTTLIGILCLRIYKYVICNIIIIDLITEDANSNASTVTEATCYQTHKYINVHQSAVRIIIKKHFVGTKPSVIVGVKKQKGKFIRRNSQIIRFSGKLYSYKRSV